MFTPVRSSLSACCPLLTISHSAWTMNHGNLNQQSFLHIAFLSPACYLSPAHCALPWHSEVLVVLPLVQTCNSGPVFSYGCVKPCLVQSIARLGLLSVSMVHSPAHPIKHADSVVTGNSFLGDSHWLTDNTWSTSWSADMLQITQTSLTSLYWFPSV